MKQEKKRILTRTVMLLGMVSLFTDMASEMLYPVMPLFLESIGFGVVGIGLLEGIAQASAGLSKGWFGQLSDRSGRRLPFVQWGYAMSAVSKPLMALWAAPLWVLFARTLDRLGKGVRTGARDALLSDEATPATKARVFGFHRSMDTLGAAIGPAIALLLLMIWPGEYRLLFFIAFLPGVLAVITTFLLREKQPQSATTPKPRPGFFAFVKYALNAGAHFRRLLAGLLLFALINSSDFFLLLMLKHQGVSDQLLIGVYIFYNLVYAAASYPAGVIADKCGIRKTYVAGLVLFAVVYAGMTQAHSWLLFGAVFFLYGWYAAATEGVAKAWISNIASKTETATAIGTYEALNSVATLLASSLAGLLWYAAGPDLLFLLTAALALLLAIFFAVYVPAPVNTAAGQKHPEKK